MFFFGRKKKDAPAQQHVENTGAQTQPGDASSQATNPREAFSSELSDAQANLVTLVYKGLNTAGIANTVDAIYVYGYIGDDRPLFDSFCRIDGSCKELVDLLGEELFGMVYLEALDGLARVRNIFQRYGQRVPLEFRGRYDARRGGYHVVFPNDTFDRGERDAGIYERIYAWMDDINAGRDDLAG